MKILPFDFYKDSDGDVIVVNAAGESLILKEIFFKMLCNEDYECMPESIINELLSKHLITYDEDINISIDLLATKLRSRKDFLSNFTTLHMVVLTMRCNCICTYCHASSKGMSDCNLWDMDTQTAKNTVDMIFKSPSPQVKIEFQGGEPLLNWEILKYIVLYAEKINLKAKKELSFVVCTNLLEITREQILFLKEHKVDISTSCDGPKYFHDCNRKSLISDSAHDSFRKNLSLCREIIGPNSVSALITVTNKNIENLKDVVDYYISLNFKNLFIRALNPYGYALDNKDELSYPMEKFIYYYKDVLNYIINLNISGVNFSESYATLLLQRILTPFPTGFVDLQSPAGAGILGTIYNYNGDVYPSDEGRMLAARNDKYFIMGNVNKDSYNTIFKSNILKKIVRESCVESLAGCSTCAFKHFCGADPIRYYVECGDIYGKRYSSSFCLKNKEIILELFRYIKENNKNINSVFWSWINR